MSARYGYVIGLTIVESNQVTRGDSITRATFPLEIARLAEILTTMVFANLGAKEKDAFFTLLDE